MAHQAIDGILNNQPDLGEANSFFEEYWVMLRSLGPIDFAAFLYIEGTVPTSGVFLAILLMGIAYYRFEQEENIEAIYTSEAWACVKNWWEELEAEKEGGAE